MRTTHCSITLHPPTGNRVDSRVGIRLGGRDVAPAGGVQQTELILWLALAVDCIQRQPADCDWLF